MQRMPVYLYRKSSSEFLEKYKDALSIMMAIVESSYDGIYITDGNANTIYINRSYEVISGLTEDDVLGRNMRDLEKEGVISRSASLLVLQQQCPVTINQEFRTGKRAIVTSTPIFDDDDKIGMVVTNVRDVSELYELRHKLDKQDQVNRRYHSEIKIFRQQMLVDGDMMSYSGKMQQLLTMANKVSKMDTPVLIMGETGVGKERLATYIYRNSPRVEKNFIKINCAAISENLIESEFFGYERGAFSGANKEGKMGFFEVAHNGTLFLDEVGELPPGMQVKLLRVLQEQEIIRVGGNRPIKVNVRIIAATNRNLEEQVAAGLFREDLYYRLNVFPLEIPPLRERIEDIESIACQMLGDLNRKYGKEKEFSQTAIAGLKEYSWPGNVRELKNIIERVFILNDDNVITAKELALNERAGQKEASYHLSRDSFDLKHHLQMIEKEYIVGAYRKHGNVRAAAKNLNMDHVTFSRKLNYYAE